MMLKQRILTAIVLLPIVLFLVLYQHSQVFAVAAALLILLTALEWSALMGLKSLPKKIVYLFSLLAMLALSYVFPGMQIMLISVAICWWLCASIGIVYYEKWQVFANRPAQQLLASVLTLAALWLSLVILHKESHYPVSILLYLLLLVWTADIGAYFAGKRWGKTSLASLISPGKTWEGVYGSLFAGTLLAVFYACLLGLNRGQLLLFLFISWLSIAVSIVGDLTESMYKRHAGVKDSGRLLPGHGGLFDRIDSLIAAAPLFVCGIWILESY